MFFLDWEQSFVKNVILRSFLPCCVKNMTSMGNYFYTITMWRMWRIWKYHSISFVRVSQCFALVSSIHLHWWIKIVTSYVKKILTIHNKDHVQWRQNICNYSYLLVSLNWRPIIHLEYPISPPNNKVLRKVSSKMVLIDWNHDLWQFKYEIDNHLLFRKKNVPAFLWPGGHVDH